jgi:hypothetical protein
MPLQIQVSFRRVGPDLILAFLFLKSLLYQSSAEYHYYQLCIAHHKATSYLNVASLFHLGETLRVHDSFLHSSKSLQLQVHLFVVLQLL